MNIQELTAYINQNIRNNGVQAITGDLMQNVLNSIVATLSDGANIVPGSVTRGAIAPGAVDNTPTAGSNNLITSTAVAAAIKAIQTVVLENKELTDTELQNIIKTANGLTDAVNDRIPISEKGMYNGVATLGEDGRVPASQLPGFVDDVKEGYLFEGKFYRDAEHTEEIEPQGDMIYIDLVTDKEYRWGGTTFAEISESLALGETAETAYAGSKGKQNAEDIERLKTGKQDTLVSGENLKTLNGESILGAGDIKISGGGAGLIPITWAELVALRDAGQLVVGGLYRLTDYEIAINEEGIGTEYGAIVASHPYDIVLTAIAPNILSEECRAMLHDEDDYYSAYNRNLSLWKLWYCIDNDTERFAWAVTTENGGKGVVYRMIDDNNIDCPYDFKQIQIGERFSTSSVTSYRYTFYLSNDTDASVTGSFQITDNVLKGIEKFRPSNKLFFPAIIRINEDFCHNIITGRYNYINSSYDADNNVILNCEGLNISGEFAQNHIEFVKNSQLSSVTSCVLKFVSSSTLSSVQNSIITTTGKVTIDTSRSIVVLNSSDSGTVATIKYGYGVVIGEYCKGINLGTINPTEGVYIGNNCSNINLSNGGKNFTIHNGCKNLSLYYIDSSIIGSKCADFTITDTLQGVTIGSRCGSIKIQGAYPSGNRKRLTLLGCIFGNNVWNINITLPSATYSRLGLYGVKISDYVRNLNINTTIENESGTSSWHYIKYMTFLQGGEESNPVNIDVAGYKVDDINNIVPARIACYNSAGEYKIFALGDLAPA